ncbi:MAG: hypothetical protein VYE81_05750 [Planctomycetota bacterium]|nr:hypothetical protein [Planctomycetota bacterium]
MQQALLLLVLLATPATAQDNPIGFLEDFALAPDRGVVLEQLVPGTSEYYFFHCLERQHARDLDAVDDLLTTWIQRHGRGGRVDEIENRQALLRADEQPGSTYEFLRKRFGLTFNHQRQVPGDEAPLPSRLDPTLISHEALTRRAFDRYGDSLRGFADSMLPGLATRNLTDGQLRELLSRLSHPILRGLPSLVVRELATRESKGFGALKIHQHLLQEQLDECAHLRPSLLNEQAFVTAYLARLAPSADVNWSEDVAEREAYLERLQSFVGRLTPVHNGLKAHVLGHRLRHDMALGSMDRGRFLAWLALPRTSSWANPEHRRRHRNEEVIQGSGQHATTLGKGGDDEQLLRAYLQHFFAHDSNYDAFRDTVSDRLLARLFAETKILLGLGDMERWYSLLDDPAAYEALRQRVEISFPPTQPTRFAAADPVSIDVDLKNVSTLLVKVFEIDAFAFYRANGREVNATIPLDGLVAGQEATHDYDDNPLRRVRRTFDFPELDRPGIFVIEFIGSGLSSRAVISKGRLQLRERRSAAGHAFRVLDERGRPCPDATLYFGGREYAAEEGGEIYVPYSTDPGEHSVILTSGARCSLDSFQHRKEQYALEAGMLMDREALLAGNQAQLLLRPRLTLADEVVALSLLEETVLEISSTRADGAGATLQMRDLELASDREWVGDIQIPPGTVELSVRLRGRVETMAVGDPVQLTSPPTTFLLNRIETTNQTNCPLLGKDDSGWFIEVLGKNGEPRPGASVIVSMDHPAYTDQIEVALRTDDDSRVHLGALDGISTLRASGLPAGHGGWRLLPTTRRMASELQGATGSTLRVPYGGSASTADSKVASLIEVRSGIYAHDRSQHLALESGYLELRDLPAGNFELLLHESDQRIGVRVTAGEILQGWALGRDRWLETSPRRPLQLAPLRVEGEELVVEVKGPTPATRVHVLANRYASPYDGVGGLRFQSNRGPQRHRVARAVTDYQSGRTISDEYRYVLERRYAEVFPGNMLDRPGVLLNPWAVNVQADVIGIGGGGGGRFGGRKGERRRKGASGGPASIGAPTTLHPATFANLDFLPDASWILVNLRPNDDGTLRIPLTQLGTGQHIRVLALDRMGIAQADTTLPWRTFVPRDGRLSESLALDRHLLEERRIDFIATDQTVTVTAPTQGDLEIYDSLSDVFRLFRTRRPDAGLEAFAFLLEWPELDDAQKRALYSEHASHELHLFLWNKDRDFFDSVAKPLLLNKIDRTFLDRWLLEEVLSDYIEPWAFGQLNVLERALLAERYWSVASAIERHLRELVELDPTPPADRSRIFEEILLGTALELGHLQNSFFAQEQERAEGSRREGPSTPGPAGPPGGGGGGSAGDGKLGALGYVDSEEREPELQDAESLITGSSDFDLGLRAGRPGLHMQLRDTERHVESNYWRRTTAQQGPDLLRVHEFWLDFAERGVDTPFLSKNFPLATGNLNEMLLALALLDLPFEDGEHEVANREGSVEITAASPLLLVRKALVDAEVSGDAPRVLVAQDLYRGDERYRIEDGQRVEAFVRGDLEAGVAYGCRIVITNPTEIAHQFEVLYQIPEGALPLLAGRATSGVPLEVGAYGTATLEYAFYFPQPGEFLHYPAHVAEGGDLVAFAESRTLTVNAERAAVDEASWEYVSQQASAEAVLTYLDGVNLQALDLQRIAWRMRDAEFYRRTLGLLRGRLVYHDGLWSYALHHGDALAAGESLRHASAFVARCGAALSSPLLEIDPVVRRSFERVEYAPLVNARAHPFGGKREITNVDVKQQYERLLDVLAHRAVLDDGDWMSVCTFMLLQDRVAGAREAFARVDPNALPARIQYDYMRAYLDFFTVDHALARDIAQAYLDHPVPHWRDRFRTVIRHLDEAQGEATDPTMEDGAETEALVASEPALELSVKESGIELRHSGLETCELRFYALDVEFLFSTSPFVKQSAGDFAFVQPNRRKVLTMERADGVTRVEMPEEFARANVLVEVRGGGIVRREARYANSLAVQVIEAHGQIKVTHATTGAPIQAVYVKVYTRTGDSVRFHKDGYTDLRGRFDYISVSGTSEANIQRIALLVLSPDDGAVIREVAPPAR